MAFSDRSEVQEIQDMANRMVRAADGLNNYAVDNQVTNLLLVDMAARMAGKAMQLLWRHQFGNRSLPYSIYPLNPRGFLKPEHLKGTSAHSLVIPEITKGASIAEILSLGTPRGRSVDQIAADLTQAYPDLMEAKAEPTLLYDNCIHTGDSIRPMLEVLAELGFTNLRCGVIADERAPWNRQDPAMDLVIDPQPKVTDRWCYAFGMNRLYQRPFDQVLSRIKPNPTSKDFLFNQQIELALDSILSSPRTASGEVILPRSFKLF